MRRLGRKQEEELNCPKGRPKIGNLLRHYLKTFCINKDIVPFNDTWASITAGLPRKRNPGRIIVNALTSALEVYLACRQQIITERGIESIEKLINNSKCHLSLLWLMRTDFLNLFIKLPQP